MEYNILIMNIGLICSSGVGGQTSLQLVEQNFSTSVTEQTLFSGYKNHHRVETEEWNIHEHHSRLFRRGINLTKNHKPERKCWEIVIFPWHKHTRFHIHIICVVKQSNFYSSLINYSKRIYKVYRSGSYEKRRIYDSFRSVVFSISRSLSFSSQVLRKR